MVFPANREYFLFTLIHLSIPPSVHSSFHPSIPPSIQIRSCLVFIYSHYHQGQEVSMWKTDNDTYYMIHTQFPCLQLHNFDFSTVPSWKTLSSYFIHTLPVSQKSVCFQVAWFTCNADKLTCLLEKQFVRELCHLPFADHPWNHWLLWECREVRLHNRICKLPCRVKTARKCWPWYGEGGGVQAGITSGPHSYWSVTVYLELWCNATNQSINPARGCLTPVFEWELEGVTLH